MSEILGFSSKRVACFFTHNLKEDLQRHAISLTLLNPSYTSLPSHRNNFDHHMPHYMEDVNLCRNVSVLRAAMLMRPKKTSD